jgi:hypothetical protein
MTIPDINKRCAELLGIEYSECKPDRNNHFFRVSTNKDIRYQCIYCGLVSSDCSEINKNFAEDIKDAEILLNKLCEISSVQVKWAYVLKKWSVSMYGEGYGLASAKTAPLAISLAFIKSQERE